MVSCECKVLLAALAATLATAAQLPLAAHDRILAYSSTPTLSSPTHTALPAALFPPPPNHHCCLPST